jgi:hypothetical protein
MIPPPARVHLTETPERLEQLCTDWGQQDEFEERSMSTLYDEIKAFDKDIADEFKAASAAGPGGKIDKAGALALFNKAITGGTIKAATMDALWVIWHKADFTADGLVMVDKILGHTFGGGVRDPAHLLRTAAELKLVFDAVTLAKPVSFTSPKLGISYNGSAYKAIEQLVIDGKIHVIVMTGTSPNPGHSAARYDPAHNLVRLFKSDVDALAHELTHAVQDWNDVKGKNKYLEADAYMVTAIAILKSGRSLPTTLPTGKPSPLLATLNDAAKRVIGGVTVSDPAWNGTRAKPGLYDRLTELLVAFPDAVEDPEVDRDLAAGESGTPEKVTFDGIVANLAGQGSPPTTTTSGTGKPQPAPQKP